MAGNTLIKLAIAWGIGLLLGIVAVDLMLPELNLILLSVGLAGIIIGLTLILDEKGDDDEEVE